jgi:hypothetical protein
MTTTTTESKSRTRTITLTDLRRGRRGHGVDRPRGGPLHVVHWHGGDLPAEEI